MKVSLHTLVSEEIYLSEIKRQALLVSRQRDLEKVCCCQFPHHKRGSEIRLKQTIANCYSQEREWAFKMMTSHILLCTSLTIRSQFISTFHFGNQNNYASSHAKLKCISMLIKVLINHGMFG